MSGSVGKGDPGRYLEADAPEVTYFDPVLEKRIDGLAAVRDHLLPLTGRIDIDHYEMIDPKIQCYGEAAVLSFNLINYGRAESGSPVLSRWNSTEVYARIEGGWRIVHSHWSYIKPVAQEGLL